MDTCDNYAYCLLSFIKLSFEIFTNQVQVLSRVMDKIFNNNNDNMIISFFALYIMNRSLNTKFKKNNMNLFSFSSQKKNNMDK